MALIKKNPPKGIRSTQSYINVSPNGLIRISQGLAIAIELKDGDFVSFYQDDEEKTNWFLAKENEGLLVKLGKNKVFKVQCKSIASEILETIQFTSPVKIKVSTEIDENKMYPIITHSAKNK